MRSLAIALTVMTGAVLLAAGDAPSGKLDGQLRKVFPTASTFAAKEGNPPVFKVYAPDPKTGQPALAGYAFWTTEIVPLERGYDGPIKMLMGLNTNGVITGVLVVEHHEPYGNFSVEPPEFAAQFKGKSIRDPFKPGMDIDAVTRATISITSATRAIKNSARQIARQYLNPEAVK
jgi:NosR/NirI family nitrous oxide reductase transcriptional regulator